MPSPMEEERDRERGSRSPPRSPPRRYSRSRSPPPRDYSRSPPRRYTPDRRHTPDKRYSPDRRYDRYDDEDERDRRRIRRTPSPPRDRDRDNGSECTFRVLAPSRLIGGLIGKGGRSINALREDTRARIKVIENYMQHGDERLVIITAAEDEAATVSRAQDALFAVQEKLVEGAREEGIDTEGRCTCRMLITSSQAGGLIGKGGVTIRSIRERSSASVRVLPPEETPVIGGTGDRVLQLAGDQKSVRVALELTSKQLRQIPSEPYRGGNARPPPRTNRYDRDDRYDRRYDNRDRYERRDREHSRERSPRFSDRERRDRERGDRDRGFPDRDRGYAERRERGDGILDAPPAPPLLQPVVPAAVPIPAIPGVQMTTKMTLSKALIGAIIGKGGSNIAQIRHLSGAKIKIHEQEEGSEDRTVEISGTSEEVQNAQKVINTFLLHSSANQQAFPQP